MLMNNKIAIIQRVIYIFSVIERSFGSSSESEK